MLQVTPWELPWPIRAISYNEVKPSYCKISCSTSKPINHCDTLLVVDYTLGSKRSWDDFASVNTSRLAISATLFFNFLHTSLEIGVIQCQKEVDLIPGSADGVVNHAQQATEATLAPKEVTSC